MATLSRGPAAPGTPLTTQQKTDVRVELGLGNVDNTSDLGKPVSTAQAAAIALKADKTIEFNLPNQAVSGSIGTAPLTVDIADSIVLNQTTAGVVLSLVAPTVSRTKPLILVNRGTATVAVAVPLSGTIMVGAGQSVTAVWNGATWSPGAPAVRETILGPALVGSSGVRYAVGDSKYVTAERPFLLSFGSSIESQDIPFTFNEPLIHGISPMLWGNGLCRGAFDQLGPYESIIAPTGGSQTIVQISRNGMLGSSGGLVRQFMFFAITPFLADVAPRIGGRKFFVNLGGGINDLSNNDSAGYATLIWADLKVIIQKVIDAGGVPVVNINEPSENFNTLNKRKNREELSFLVQTFAAGRADIAVANIDAAWHKYGRGVTLERMTRGFAGDKVHPNVLGAIIRGFAFRDAVDGRVKMSPPWESEPFTGLVVAANPVMAGAAGTKGTNASGTSAVPDNWTLGSNGAATSAHSFADGAYGASGTRVLYAASAGVAADGMGLSNNAAAAVTSAGPVYRAWVDYDIVKADNVKMPGYRVRTTGGLFSGVGSVGSSDDREETAATATAPYCPSPLKLLEGQRICLASSPFQAPASPLCMLYNVGGAEGGFNAPTL
jgi:hypothetical protein